MGKRNPTLNRTDKIYKVKLILAHLPKFRHSYNTRQHLTLDERMIPAKNRLAIQLYIKDKPTKWGSKSFLLCESGTGYIINTAICSGKTDAVIENDELGTTANVLCSRIQGARVDQRAHIVFVDRF